MDWQEVERLARCQCPRNPALADELVAHVMWQTARGRYQPERGSFQVWSRRVMRNARVSAWQQQRRRQALPNEPTDQRARLVDVEQRERLAAPFGSADMARLRRWAPADRVLLLSRSHLWPKYPAAEWVADCAACGITWPFPTFDIDTPLKEQFAQLAGALGLSNNTMHQRWRRGRPLLFELTFVRELAADYGEGLPNADDLAEADESV